MDFCEFAISGGGMGKSFFSLDQVVVKISESWNIVLLFIQAIGGCVVKWKWSECFKWDGNLT